MSKIKYFIVCYTVILIGSIQSLSAQSKVLKKVPVIVITDLYFPYQDPGDNFDLIMGYALPNIDLKAVIFDVTNAFRKPLADNPYLWHDPRGPREPGIIPVEQLNYIFNENIPFGMGTFTPMGSMTDKMLDVPEFQQSGVDLLMKILKQSKEKLNILSFGSARVLAVAYNRDSALLREKIKRIYLSAGTASPDFEIGTDNGANAIPGGEWNVALDKWAFVRILRSDLPVAMYPCAAKDGAFVLDEHNTYWKLPNLQFIREMDAKLQRYLTYQFEKTLSYDFLRAMNVGETADSVSIVNDFPSPHHVWETALWLQVSNRKLVERHKRYKIILKGELRKSDRILSGHLVPCLIHVRDDGRFVFEKTTKKTNFWIYERSNPELNQAALQQALPDLYISFKP